jgi:hypothetical protein
MFWYVLVVVIVGEMVVVDVCAFMVVIRVGDVVVTHVEKG